MVFAPALEEVYPGGDPVVTVEPGPLGTALEGASRPGHFRGVLTVVAKLFGLVRPDLAVFGEKDYQQLVLVRRMSQDLCLGVDIVGAETVREPDGLALSSRNRYLSPDDRQRATVLSRALYAAQERAAFGLPAARWAAMRVLDEVPESEARPGLSRDPYARPGRGRRAAPGRVGGGSDPGRRAARHHTPHRQPAADLGCGTLCDCQRLARWSVAS